MDNRNVGFGGGEDIGECWDLSLVLAASDENI
jgi:hypothetical protein